MSQLSLHSNSSQSEDWGPFTCHERRRFTKRCENSTTGWDERKRSLSELLRLHSEKGTECRFSPEEAARVAEVLGQWINASSSPYEDEDDFFTKGSQDDISLPKRSPSALSDSRPRGQSESANSRPPSSAGKRS
ncbi:hypothetical protein J3R30DRAFT_3696796 [Lentinula aciculospora]|uniref:Uncharacterized protein n=1 Tax=Lentinula aciculospora TaxID=153920 RepID=A0A9W9ALD9_9AGAR|nr:hypothetical protein J3R30DRAFT_3696796 [Lentinula aciculospora]